jgi:hypothetical protein
MKKTASPQLATIIVIGLAQVMIAACATSTPQQTQNTNQSPQIAQSAPAKTEPPAPAPSTPPPPTAPIIASADGDTPGSKVEIHELKRTSGDTLTLRFSMVNSGDKAISFNYNFVEQGKDVVDFNSVGGVHLIDPVGKKKYFVVRDTEDQPSCSKGLRDLAPGGRSNLWSKFPAPPEGVQMISVVVPHFGPMDDVPIGR